MVAPVGYISASPGLLGETFPFSRCVVQSGENVCREQFKWIQYAGWLAIILISSTAVPAYSQEACAYGSAAYSKGAQVCFKNVTMTCEGPNRWFQRGGCTNNMPESGTPITQSDFGGTVCISGPKFYSPGAEGCITGAYQRCEQNGQWMNREPVAGAECK